MTKHRTHPGTLASVHAAGRGIVIKIEGDGSSAAKALQLVEEHLREVRHESGETSEAIERVKGALETVGLYLGIREAIEGIKELTVGSLELGEALEKASKRSGLAVESLSVLHYAAGVTGSDFDGLVSGLSKFENTIAKAADGDAKASGFMKSLGLNAKELTQRSDGAEIAFHKFLQTLAATENPLERNRLAMGLLGKAGAAQIPVLLEIAENWDLFKQKAEAAGVLLTGETADALAHANQQLNDLKQHFTGAGLALTEGLTPALENLIGSMQGGEKTMDAWTTFGKFIGANAELIASGLLQIGSAIEDIAGVSAIAVVEATSLGIKLGNFVTGNNIEGASGASKALDAQARTIAEALDRHRQRISEASSALSEGGREFYLGPKSRRSGLLGLIDDSGRDLIGEGKKNSGGPHGKGFEGADATGKPAKSGNAIAEATTQLLAEQAKATADLQKSQNAIQIAELESQHRQLLVSDQQFFVEKLQHELAALDAESKALTDKRAGLQTLAAKQHGDGTLKRDKQGRSAEELKTQREILRVGEELDALDTRRAQVTSGNTAEIVLNQREQELATLKIAAELEKERGVSIEHQLALIEREHGLQADKLTLNGDTQGAADARAAGDVLAQKLRIADVERQIAETEAGYRQQAQAVEDRAGKGRESKLEAEHELNALRGKEAADLQSLVAQYDALAQTLGGPFKTKAAELHAELDKLNDPDRHVETEFGKKLADSFGGVVTSIADKAAQGKESVAQMAQSILHDMENLALKMAEQKFVLPFFQQAFGVPTDPSSGGGFSLGSLFGHGSGAAPTAGPSLYTPAKQGGGGSVFGGIATGLAKAGGAALAPKVTHNIINQSSQPVTSGAPQVSWDSQFREMIVHTILSDKSEGGPISQVWGSD